MPVKSTWVLSIENGGSSIYCQRSVAIDSKMVERPETVSETGRLGRLWVRVPLAVFCSTKYQKRGLKMDQDFAARFVNCVLFASIPWSFCMFVLFIPEIKEEIARFRKPKNKK